MVTNSEINTTNPIGIVSGGTNTATLATTNGTIYFDGTELNTTATGTSGYALTSNGGVSAPTYQVLPSTAGAWTLIQTQTASSSASLNFSITNTYTNYAVIFDSILAASSGQSFTLLLSTNAGSSFISSYNGGYYSYAPVSGPTTVVQSPSASSSYLPLSIPNVTYTGDSSSTPAVPLSGTAYLTALTTNAATYYPTMFMDCAHATSGAPGVSCNWVTAYGVTTTDTLNINYLSFSFTSGDIASGTISLFGISS
jgi:hypothetical protein